MSEHDGKNLRYIDGEYFHKNCPSVGDDPGGEMNMALGKCEDCGKTFPKNIIKADLSSSLKTILKGDDAQETGFRQDWGRGGE